MSSQEKYPRSVWSRFRQLMRQPKAQRMRRDMAVCAILLGVSEGREGRVLRRRGFSLSSEQGQNEGANGCATLEQMDLLPVSCIDVHAV